jgi:hypothetical protein
MYMLWPGDGSIIGDLVILCVPMIPQQLAAGSWAGVGLVN